VISLITIALVFCGTGAIVPVNSARYLFINVKDVRRVQLPIV